jgi:hypothetical protein
MRKLIGALLLTAWLTGCGGGSGGGSASSASNSPFGLSPASIAVSTTEGESVALASTLTLNTKVVTGDVYFAFRDNEGAIQSNASLSQSSSTTGIVTFYTETTLTIGTHTGTIDIYACKEEACNNLYGSGPVTLSYAVTIAQAPPAATISPASISVTAEAGDPISAPLTATVTSSQSPSVFAISDANGLFSSTVNTTYQSSGVYSLVVTAAAINQAGTYSGTLNVYLCTSSPCSADADVPGSPVAVPYTITITPLVLLDPVVTATGLPEWGTYQGNASHTGYVPVTLDSSQFSTRWTWINPNSATGTLTPVTTGSGKVVAVSSGYFSNAYLYAINESTGTTDWQYSFGSIFAVNHPAVADGRVFVASSGHEDTFMWSFDIGDGSLEYQTAFESQGEHYLAPVVKSGYVYTDGGYFGGMYRFKERTGALNWFGTLEQYDLWSPVVDDNYAYAYTGYGFYALNLADGSQVFKVNNSSFNWWGYSLNDAPVLPGDGSVLVVDGVFNFGRAHANHLIRYSVSGKNESWRVDGSFVSDPAVANGTLYVINAATNALEARAVSTGALQWSWVPNGTDETVVVSNIVLTDNLAFVTTSAATHAVDLSTHQSVWSDAHTGHLALSSNKVLYITSDTAIRAISLE